MIMYLGNIKKHLRFAIRPTQILVMGFLAIIILGAILLNLPVASNDGQSIGFIDALFTATSAVCVTGLVVVNTLAHWTLFGKIIILLLIQIGGLGFMTLTTAFFIIMGRRITLKERLVIQEAMNQYNLSGMVRLVRSVVLGTFLVEGIGALFLAFRFVPEFGLGQGLFNAVFHSISAFCNAGFDIIGSSLTPYYGDFLVNITIMSLIILGGLGFTVWINLLQMNKERHRKGLSWREGISKLSLHTKLVLILTITLLLFGWAYFFLVEFNNPNTLGSMNLYEKLVASLFQSVTTRTAGFNTFDLTVMKDASKFMTMVLMFIGGSPAGTAGGVKTVTIGVIILTVVSTIRGKDRTEIFNRTISESVIRKAIAVAVISVGVVMAVITLLSISQNGEFMDIFFESVSAFGTVGLSLDYTSSLNTFGKVIIMITMFIGRLGPITMAWAFTVKGKRTNNNIKLPEEKVMVG